MSSKRRLRRKVCGNKNRYVSTNAARDTIGKLKRQGKLNGIVNIYKCKFCKGWHLGHAPNFIQRKLWDVNW